MALLAKHVESQNVKLVQFLDWNPEANESLVKLEAAQELSDGKTEQKVFYKLALLSKLP